MNLALNTFKYNNKTWIKSVPNKRLFNSTMVHEVITRGDIFATCLETGELTIIPGTAIVEISVLPKFDKIPTYDEGYATGYARGSIELQRLKTVLSDLINK